MLQFVVPLLHVSNLICIDILHVIDSERSSLTLADKNWTQNSMIEYVSRHQTSILWVFGIVWLYIVFVFSC